MSQVTPRTTDAAAAGTPDRLDRRAAMKAALVGAGMAATWSAPRVLGLSIAPDYASAASFTHVDATLVDTHPAAWGGVPSIGFCTGAPVTGDDIPDDLCGIWDAPAVNLPIPGSAESFELGATLKGTVKTNGSTTVSLSGITNNTYSCDVTISGVCDLLANYPVGNAGTLNGTGTTTLTTSNPTTVHTTTCNGTGDLIVSTITVTVSCIY